MNSFCHSYFRLSNESRYHARDSHPTPNTAALCYVRGAAGHLLTSSPLTPSLALLFTCCTRARQLPSKNKCCNRVIDFISAGKLTNLFPVKRKSRTEFSEPISLGKDASLSCRSSILTNHTTNESTKAVSQMDFQ
eukprot:891655-Amphidinium_carterae.1